MRRNRRKPQRKQRRRKITKGKQHRKTVSSKQSLERRRIERQQEKLRKMSLKFGKTVAPNFGRAFQNSKRQLTKHPYLNYLRHFKSKHPSYGFTRILREGAESWKRMCPEERQNFTQKEVLKSLRKSSNIPSKFDLFSKRPVQFDYYPRSLSVRRNVARKLRNRNLLPRQDRRGRASVNPRIWQNFNQIQTERRWWL
ncbi:PREDICTED: uncharacterized protein LOC108373056 [Rhagoletis zephyria]|uniref:uncharacterized protein LOC108373056 n=1 Tax=Rhagoletis zephyria TaxID=28612 RepID=UPI00081157D7|nr:PREDICTED: uncharacterized protein LOC108373056 [Rhagoletis zephyria]